MPMLIERDRTPVASLMPGRRAFDLCRQFEGLSLKAYPDPATGGDPWTCGFGHTRGVTPGMVIDSATAERWLIEDLAQAASIIRATVTAPLTQGEFDALCSLVLNLGKVPKSLLACLNGGKVDTGQEMAPGSYGSAMRQFVRNCRASAKPMLGLYRRRLAECCVYSGLPFENATSVNLVRLKVLPNGAIDPDESTTLDETLERAMRDIPVDTGPRPDFNKPYPPVAAPPIAADPAPTSTIVKDDLPPPAPPRGPEIDASVFEEEDEAPPLQAPAVEVGEAPAVNQPPSPLPAPNPLPPISPAPPRPPAVIQPKTIDVNAIPYGQVEPENGAKNMSDSKRGMGMVIVGIGSVIQVITARLGIASVFGAVFYDLSRDPVVIALVVGGLIWGVGFITRKRGGHVMKNGMTDATTLLK